ncbi:hypothetical protein JVT61DRAFT_15249 [Boletus reticuloceps]|uniref:PX-domain-containing protein n=1 Tax=Boletus reticuloceps TaxID=495285 RepID=A0A8I2YSU3_9AGAM|nr:hypothetical protein JVT61DRAFT_15249 [Boletus reticuloceps]
MATLPRTAKQSSTPTRTSAFDHRPRSDHSFDAGINSSAAWTEHLDRGSLSDDEPADYPELYGQRGLSARALYQFEGKAEFRELTVEAGDRLEVLKQDVGDGWSLVKTEDGKVGLLPTAYYTHTIDFLSAPADSQPISKELSTDTVTPHASPKGNSESELPPLVPQTTGEWPNVPPSFRQRLLGGKTINRFSAFVTSGAEEWVLNGAPAPEDEPAAPNHISHSRFSTTDSVAEDIRLSRLGIGEADRHFVDEGPAWQPKIPEFRVLVHSPSKRSSGLSGAYTVYKVTSLVHSPEKGKPHEEIRSASPIYITVQRRFSHFVVLHTALLRRLPGIALTPLPEKQYAGRFNAAFVEARRGDLERYLDRVVRHPIARYAEVVTSFLGCEDDLEWTRMMPRFLLMRAAGPSFFAHVFHPAFNFDIQDASEVIEKFNNHVRAVGKGVQGLRSTFNRVREARIEMSKAERSLSYSLLSLITAKPSSSAPALGADEEEENASPQLQGLLNNDGAWCWREDCQDCLNLTKAVQKTAETLQSVADLYDDHARRRQLATHEAFKSVAHPYMTYQGIIETHRSTYSRYAEATGNNLNEDVASRCETVLNATMSELDTYHTQKVEDFTSLTKDHLDGEIALYEQMLTRLKAARRTLDPPHLDELGRSPRRPSRFEKDLDRSVNDIEPLPQPCPHVYDSAPMRPVSMAIQGGMGLLLGSSSSGGRTSVLGRLWA